MAVKIFFFEDADVLVKTTRLSNSVERRAEFSTAFVWNLLANVWTKTMAPGEKKRRLFPFLFSFPFTLDMRFGIQPRLTFGFRF